MSKELDPIAALPSQGHFGSDVAALGDVNGDGFPDVAVGLRRPIPAGTGQVRILLLDGIADTGGEVIIGPGEGGFGGTLNVGDEFGASLAALGDIDGNGVPDLAVGAPGDDDAGDNAGAVWILFLASDASVLDTLKITELSGGFNGVLDADDNFGRAIGVLGDIDGNGAADLVVGAPGDDVGGTDHGAIWTLLISNDSTGSVIDQRKIGDGQSGFDGDLDQDDAFGYSVDGVGDLNGDEIPDVIVGAPGDDDGGNNRGAVWLICLESNGVAAATYKISDQVGGFDGILDNSDEFGTSVAAIGDLDGNGLNEIGVGARFDDDGGNNSGAVWVLILEVNGEATDVVRDFAKISAGDVPGTTASIQFGYSVTGLGDIDGDGLTEIAIGAPTINRPGIAIAGAVWIVYVSGTPFCGTGTVLDAMDAHVDVLFVNGEAGRYLGRQVSVAFGDPIWAAMVLPPSQGTGKFVVHGNLQSPVPGSYSELPQNVGTVCFSMIRAKPAIVWNNLGKEGLVGESRDFDEGSIPDPPLAPSIFAYFHNGDAEHLPPGTTLTLQGVIMNPSSESPLRASSTNAVVLNIE